MIVVRNDFQKKQTNISYFIIRQIIYNFDVLNENQFSIFHETIYEWFFTMFDFFENSKFIWTSKFARQSNLLNICTNTFSKKNDFVNVNIVFKNNIRRINNSRIHDNDNDRVVDEMKIFHNVRWIDFCEIVWNFFDLFIDDLKFAVNRLTIHLFNKQKIMFNFENINDDQMLIRENFRRITLIQYFDINRKIKRILNVDKQFSSTFEHLNIFKKNWIIYIKKYQNILFE